MIVPVSVQRENRQDWNRNSDHASRKHVSRVLVFRQFQAPATRQDLAMAVTVLTVVIEVWYRKAVHPPGCGCPDVCFALEARNDAGCHYPGARRNRRATSARARALLKFLNFQPRGDHARVMTRNTAPVL